MRLSVVIPTRDRPDLVADCVASLAAQAQPPGGMEVIVVDDGSAEPISVRGGDGLHVRCLRQPGQGLNVARNNGFAEAGGEIVAFLDDDTIVADGWANAVHEGFESTGCDALGGRIRLRFEGERPTWLSPRQYSFLSAYDLGDEPREVTTRLTLPFGANFGVTREALERTGGFRPDLDRIGSTLISNGETEFLLRLLDEGARIAYWPAAGVEHRVASERLEKEWFRRRALAQGMSDVRTIPPGPRTDSLVRGLLLTREFVFLLGGLPRALRAFAGDRSRFDLGLWWTYCRGRREEARRYRLRA